MRLAFILLAAACAVACGEGCGQQPVHPRGDLLEDLRAAVRLRDVLALNRVLGDIRSSPDLEPGVLSALAESLQGELRSDVPWLLDRPPSEEALLACGNRGIPYVLRGHEAMLSEALMHGASFKNMPWWPPGFWGRFGAGAQDVLARIVADEAESLGLRFGAVLGLRGLHRELSVQTVLVLLRCAVTDGRHLTRLWHAGLGVLARSKCLGLRGLVVAAGSPDVGIRRYSAEILGCIACEQPAVEQALSNLLSDMDVGVQAHASVSLRQRGDSRSDLRTYVERAMRHIDPTIRLVGVSAVCHWPGDSAWREATLEDVAQHDPDESVRKEADRRLDIMADLIYLEGPRGDGEGESEER